MTRQEIGDKERGVMQEDQASNNRPDAAPEQPKQEESSVKKTGGQPVIEPENALP